MANSYCITTDSTADMPGEFYDTEGIDVIPYTYMLGDDVFLDDRLSEEQYDQFFKRMSEEKLVSKTTQVNFGQFIEFFEPKLKAGKDIIHLHFAGVLSGSYQNALQVAKKLREDYPERKIEIIDTKSATVGLGLMLWYVARKQKDGYGFTEMVEYIENLRKHLCHHFTLDDLNHLFRGGRLSKTQAMVGSMLQMKPILEITAEGHVNVLGKVRGRKQSIAKLLNMFYENYDPERNDIVFVGHTLSLNEAKEVAKEIEKKMGLTNFFFHSVGPVIGSHLGAGGVGLFYIGKTR